MFIQAYMYMDYGKVENETMKITHTEKLSKLLAQNIQCMAHVHVGLYLQPLNIVMCTLTFYVQYMYNAWAPSHICTCAEL